MNGILKKESDVEQISLENGAAEVQCVMNRRAFLKRAAAVTAAFAVSPAVMNGAEADRRLRGVDRGQAVAKESIGCRTLGTGSAAMEVSALGFGVMGMTYNRQTLPRFQPEAIRKNLRIVDVLQQFGRMRGMTSAQVALGWLLQKAPWIVPIPGTTKHSHLDENLYALAFNVSPAEWKELDTAVSAISVVGERYNAEQQKQIMA